MTSFSVNGIEVVEAVQTALRHRPELESMINAMRHLGLKDKDYCVAGPVYYWNSYFFTESAAQRLVQYLREQTPAPTVQPVTIPETGFLRVKQIIPAIIPIAESTWWAGVKSGLYPKGVKLGPRVTAWRAEDIRAVVDGTYVAPKVNTGDTP